MPMPKIVGLMEAVQEVAKFGFDLREQLDLAAMVRQASFMVNNGEFVLMVCDYSNMKGYDALVALDVVEIKTDRQMLRLNIK